MTKRNTTPVAYHWADDEGGIVTKTHDVELAREAMLDHFTTIYGPNDDDVLECMQVILDEEPRLEYGRWSMCGSASVDEGYKVWMTKDGPGPGITRAVVWYA